MPQISIIVPVYGVEKSLHRCLDSIIAQTFTDWECLLVDDGSKDRSGVICDEYVQKDNRFRVIHKTNGGVAMARQTGLDNAVGSYIIHIDSDDYAEPEMLENMLHALLWQDVDILITDFFYIDSKGHKQLFKQEFKGNNIRQLSTEILYQHIHGSLWNKLVKNDCVKVSCAKFYSGINYCEDVLFWAQMAKCNFRVGYHPNAYYNYVYTPGSITKQLDYANYEMRKQFVFRLEELDIDRNAILHEAHSIKLLALNAGLLNKKEYYSFYPANLYTAVHRKYVHEAIFGIFAYFHLFCIGSLIYKSYVVLSKIKTYIKK